MRNFLGVKCSRKAFYLDQNQELIFSKPATKPLRKYAKVHPTPPPLILPEIFKEASQIQDQPQKLLLPEITTGDYASKSRRVRVVVTKKQLKQMLKDNEALKSMGVTIQSANSLGGNGGGSPRWRPSLAAIAE